MKNDKFKNYLHDLGVLIKEKANQAKIDKDISSNSDDSDYQIGYLMALYEVIDIMKQQAIAFNITGDNIGLADIDPDLDLL